MYNILKWKHQQIKLVQCHQDGCNLFKCPDLETNNYNSSKTFKLQFLIKRKTQATAKLSNVKNFQTRMPTEIISFSQLFQRVSQVVITFVKHFKSCQRVQMQRSTGIFQSQKRNIGLDALYKQWIAHQSRIKKFGRV